MNKRSLFSRFTNKIKDIIYKRELVGEDKTGNRYYRVKRWKEDAPYYTGETREKREVDLIDKEYNPNNIPAVWLAWLHRYRKDPPTPEEIKRIEEEAEIRRLKVVKLEEEERKRKYKKESLQSQDMPVDSKPDMQRFIEQLTAKGYGGAGGDKVEDKNEEDKKDNDKNK